MHAYIILTLKTWEIFGKYAFDVLVGTLLI